MSGIVAKTKSPKELLDQAYNLDSDKDTQELYKDWAETYDTTMLEELQYVTPRKTASLLADMMKAGSVRLLDVGSGTGLAGEYLARHGFHNIDALDYSLEMLKVAEKRQHNGSKIYSSCIVADLNKPLELASNSYGGMICTGTFTHAHVGSDCLDELFRILKPGGFFGCTVHKDVWEEAGFADKVKELASKGVMRTRGMTMDIYFENDEEPQGWYIVWEKLS